MLALRLVGASVTALLPQPTGEGASALADMGLTPATLGDTAAEFSSALAAAMQEAVGGELRIRLVGKARAARGGEDGAQRLPRAALRFLPEMS